MTVPLTECVVIEPFQFVRFLNGGPEPVEEVQLRLLVDHKVGARDQELSRSLNGLAVLYHARRGVVQIEKNLDADGPSDKWIGSKAGDAVAVVREVVSFDIGLDRKVTEQPVEYCQRRPSKWHI